MFIEPWTICLHFVHSFVGPSIIPGNLLQTQIESFEFLLASQFVLWLMISFRVYLRSVDQKKQQQQPNWSNLRCLSNNSFAFKSTSDGWKCLLVSDNAYEFRWMNWFFLSFPLHFVCLCHWNPFVGTIYSPVANSICFVPFFLLCLSNKDAFRVRTMTFQLITLMEIICPLKRIAFVVKRIPFLNETLFFRRLNWNKNPNVICSVSPSVYPSIPATTLKWNCRNLLSNRMRSMWSCFSCFLARFTSKCVRW